MSVQKPKIPVVFMAFANERSQRGFLRKLTIELKSIMNALETAVQKGRCQLKILPAATQDEIAKVFQDEWYEGRIWIFHYGGHADEDELWLETADGGNQSFFSLGLARFLGAQKGMKLVFLNGCATEEHAKHLLESNISAVIATSRKIDDNKANRFSTIFYQGLASGASIDEAFREAEGILLGEHGPEAFKSESGTRSLFWDDKPEEETLDLPWRLFLKSESSWHPAQWRLFHELKESDAEDEVAAEAFVGETIHNYKIIQMLGQGSLGTVYKAVHIDLNEERAIKITHRVLEGYERLKEILIAGHKGLGSIKHPNVVDFYDVGEMILFGQKRLYMVMELVKGQRLDKMDYESFFQSKEDVNRLIDIAIQVSTGLEAAHKTKFEDANGMPREGIIHGNIKARKILFTTKGIPKLIDFMFTDLTRQNQVRLDTPESVKVRDRGERLEDFTAPELLRGETSVNKQTDIYALGTVLFEVSTGKSFADFNFNSETELYKFVKNQRKVFPKNLSKAIFEATRPNPDERYKNVGEVIAAIVNETSFFKRLLYWFRRK